MRGHMNVKFIEGGIDGTGFFQEAIMLKKFCTGKP